MLDWLGERIYLSCIHSPRLRFFKHQNLHTVLGKYSGQSRDPSSSTTGTGVIGAWVVWASELNRTRSECFMRDSIRENRSNTEFRCRDVSCCRVIRSVRSWLIVECSLLISIRHPHTSVCMCSRSAWIWSTFLESRSTSLRRKTVSLPACPKFDFSCRIPDFNWSTSVRNATTFKSILLLMDRLASNSRRICSSSRLRLST